MNYDDNAQKFLLKHFPSKAFLRKANVQTIRQGYIRSDKDSEVKIVEKKETNEYWLICKATSRKRRKAKKMKIDKLLFDFLFELTKEHRVIKKRFTIFEGNFELRFDRFVSQTKFGRLKILEVDKIASQGDSQKRYLFPKNEIWCKDAIEISDRKKYFNQNLAA